MLPTIWAIVLDKVCEKTYCDESEESNRTIARAEPPPILTKPLSVDPKQHFSEGEKSASISAEILCQDFAKISWFKDSAAIYESGDAKYRMIWSGATKRLVVATPLAPEDNGVYEIVVEHKGGGRISSLIDIHVAGGDKYTL